MKNIRISCIRLSVYIDQRTGVDRWDHLRTLRSEICIPGSGLTRKPVDPGGGQSWGLLLPPQAEYVGARGIHGFSQERGETFLMEWLQTSQEESLIW